MKNAFFSLTALALLTLAMSSCRKDPTFKEQLVGNWKSVEVKAGTSDLSGSTTFDLRLQATDEFDLDVTYIVPLTGKQIQSYSGDWVANLDKHDITLTYNGTGETKTWEVTAIADLSLTAELVEDNIRYQVTFQRQ